MYGFGDRIGVEYGVVGNRPAVVIGVQNAYYISKGIVLIADRQDETVFGIQPVTLFSQVSPRVIGKQLLRGERCLAVARGTANHAVHQPDLRIIVVGFLDKHFIVRLVNNPVHVLVEQIAEIVVLVFRPQVHRVVGLLEDIGVRRPIERKAHLPSVNGRVQ